MGTSILVREVSCDVIGYENKCQKFVTIDKADEKYIGRRLLPVLKNFGFVSQK